MDESTVECQEGYCRGYDFKRHGRRWGKCGLDGTIFPIEAGKPRPAHCPLCGRKWIAACGLPAFNESNAERDIDFPYFKELLQDIKGTLLNVIEAWKGGYGIESDSTVGKELRQHCEKLEEALEAPLSEDVQREGSRGSAESQPQGVTAVGKEDTTEDQFAPSLREVTMAVEEDPGLIFEVLSELATTAVSIGFEAPAGTREREMWEETAKSIVQCKKTVRNIL